MTSERSKRRDFLSLVFILKSISKKLLIEKMKINENKIETKIFMAYRCHRPESLAVMLKQIWPLAFEMNRGLKTKN